MTFDPHGLHAEVAIHGKKTAPRRSGAVVLLAALLSPAGCRPAPIPPPAAAERPNVLLYVIDTLRADSLGCYGHPVVQSPVIDRLAAEGALFENAFAPSSWTRASMASILTGLYPEIHAADGRDDALHDDVTTLPEAFRRHGYDTACITANPNIGSFFGFRQGFDAFLEMYERRDRGFVEGEELVTPSDEITRQAVQWIQKARRPFFLMILSIDPHTPYRPPAEFDRYKPPRYDGGVDGSARAANRKDVGAADRERLRSLYYAEITFNDHSLGGLIDALRAQSLLDRTICAVTSDHGEEFWEHGEHGHGKTLFDEVLRVPLILRYPPRVAPKRRIADAARLIDLFPTLLDLAGVPAPPHLEGRSLFGPPPRGAPPDVFSSLRLARKRTMHHAASLRRPPWKYIWDLQNDRRSLFDLSRDGGERHSVAEEQPAQAAAMHQRLREHLRACADQRRRLNPGAASRPTSDRDLSDRARRALQELGYLDD